MEEKEKPRKKISKGGRITLIILSIIVVLVIVGIALYQVPAIKRKVYPYITIYKARIVYFFKPPSKTTFDPSVNTTMDAGVIATLTAMAPTATPSPEPTATAEPAQATETLIPVVPSATPTPTVIPAQVSLEGIVQEYQRFNSCGPTNLALALRYWGWEGEPIDIEKVIKPTLADLNVTPHEMLYYIQNHTELNALIRYGGDLELLKKFVAAGFPVLIERGYINRDSQREGGWMGHYGVIDAYDDERGAVHIPDTFNGYIWVNYERLQSDWDEFAGTYLLIFEPEDEAKILSLLGEQADPAYNLDYTLDKFRTKLENSERHEQYFIWYTLGELLVMKKDYVEAAKAFDEAFAVYGWLPLDDRPWRMLWYQVGPYEAYYYTGRYDDVVSLAYKTVTDASEPALPETFLWSARAQIKKGNIVTATFELKRALQYHPGWEPALAELKALGVEP